MLLYLSTYVLGTPTGTSMDVHPSEGATNPGYLSQDPPVPPPGTTGPSSYNEPKRHISLYSLW